MLINRQTSPIYKLIISILICELTGVISGLLSNNGINTWFKTLNKPTWNPPAYLFGPVWAILYLLMAISLWLVWKRFTPQKQKLSAIIIFATQLFLNFWWSILFFKLQSPFLAFIDILFMLVFILITIYKFSAISKIAAWLLIPYFLWVSFATFLNYTIWILNK